MYDNSFSLEIFDYLAEAGVNMDIIDKNGYHPITNKILYQKSNTQLEDKYFE